MNLSEMKSKLQDKFDEIMADYDFAKIAAYMKLTNWKWATTVENEPPNEREIRRTVSSLFYSMKGEWDGQQTRYSTGGFAWHIYKWEYSYELRLDFNIQGSSRTFYEE